MENLEENRIKKWVKDNLNYEVASVHKLSRWRPSWNVEAVSADGKDTLSLHFRGDRGQGLETQPLEQEKTVIEFLGAHGLPVPKIYGWCDSPTAIVMENVAGSPYEGGAESDPQLLKLVEDYVSHLARIHNIDVAEISVYGIDAPEWTPDLPLSYLHLAEDIYFKNKEGPEPLIEFVRRWVRRNVPKNRTKCCLLLGDVPQFIHSDSEIKAMIDIEMTRFGDPMFDLASIRVRDTLEPTGHQAHLFKHYEAVSGEPVDPDVISFYSALEFIAVPMITVASLRKVRPHPAYVEYLSWILSGMRCALESIAEINNIELSRNIDLASVESDHSYALEDLIVHLKNQPTDSGFYLENPSLSLANYALRADQLGPSLAQLEIEGINDMLGESFESLPEARTALEAFVSKEDVSSEEKLLRFFHKLTLGRLKLIQDYDSPVVTRGLGSMG